MGYRELHFGMPALRLSRPTAILEAVLLGVLVAFLLVASWQAPVEPPPRPALTLDIGPDVPTVDTFPKWTHMVRRTWARERSWSKLCSERLLRPCRLQDWQRFLTTLEPESGWAQLVAVNEFVNGFGYRPDKANWGTSDYWAAPGEFFSAGGDCEDFAIAKYYSLKALGFPVERMRIVVLNDTKRRLAHAVLVVEIGPYELVLDSVDDELRLWDDVPHYRPVYSINEESWSIPRGRRLI